MLDKNLSNEIIKQQGDLLFTTLAEECTELAQACCKINRRKYHKINYTDVLDNFFEEICDVQINLELIKQEVIKELGISETEYNQHINTWTKVKEEKLKNVFSVATMEEYYQILLKAKYINENSEPIKCIHCGSTDLEDCEFYKEDYYVVEYTKKCKHCKEILGHWAYGSWDIF